MSNTNRTTFPSAPNIASSLRAAKAREAEEWAEDRAALTTLADALDLDDTEPAQLAQHVLLLCSYMLYDAPEDAADNGARKHVEAIRAAGYPTLASLVAGNGADDADAPMLLKHLASACLREDPHMFFHAGTHKLPSSKYTGNTMRDTAQASVGLMYRGRRLTALSRFDLIALCAQLLQNERSF